jgi:multidrug efflux system membrane fusion protein
MTTYHLTRPRMLLVAGALLVIAALTVTVVVGGDDATGSSRLGPTVTAEPRDLATTLEASGSLQRSDEQVVAHASALPSDSGGDGDGDSLPSEPVSYVPEPDATSPSSSSSTSSTTSTTDPCSPTSTAPTSTSTSSSTTSTSSTTTPTPCPPTSTTTSTTSTTTSTTPPDVGDGGGERPPADDHAPDDGDDAAPANGPDDGSRPAGSSPGGGSGPAGSSPGGGGDGGGGDGGDVPSAVLTGLLDVGATAGRGTVLYTADEQPVVALIGDLPAWRTLEQGVDDGEDVRQLEENLVALGYGGDLDVDETFTADTAAAVEAWETDLGRASPDGVVTLGDVVFLSEPGDILGHEASVGDTLEAGSPVLTIGSEQRIVVADVDATEAGGWTPGSTVELEWADGTTTEGTVIGTGRDVTDGQVELSVAVGAGDPGAGERRSGAEATVTLVHARRDGVVAVPVAAIIDDGGSPAVRVAQPDGPDRTSRVETGLVADGWIEITAGLDGGEEIRLPG